MNYAENPFPLCLIKMYNSGAQIVIGGLKCIKIGIFGSSHDVQFGPEAAKFDMLGVLYFHLTVPPQALWGPQI